MFGDGLVPRSLEVAAFTFWLGAIPDPSPQMHVIRMLIHFFVVSSPQLLITTSTIEIVL
jgi:hypothetical protein